MKFLAGFVTAFIVSAVGAFLVIVSGVYDVAATAPHTPLGRAIFSWTMRNSVRVHAGNESPETWSEDQARKGFKDYDAMCVICHSAPGKERSYISKGLQPEPPNLAEASERWSSAELFWIIKNGVKMTAMPAFGPTHQDEQIWNIVAFVRRLPRLSAEQFRAMESEIRKSSENEQDRHHQ
ncbi:cytochrome c [Methylocystis sp. H4A]|uniref:c-type cytochrome n=1 Tax=Methylocystis sp. H4A TaxID=2785788 RepID=UPI0018C30282|nr:cytochrome c [Methylocystis sp. H4A]MBG0800182.1 cytochrome c [Methylocystis sp. H4A]